MKAVYISEISLDDYPFPLATFRYTVDDWVTIDQMWSKVRRVKRIYPDNEVVIRTYTESEVRRV